MSSCKGVKNMLPISDILIRSISGYVFIIPVLILYFFVLKKSGRKQSVFHIIAVFVFCYYLFGNAICEEPSIERAALRTGQGCGIDGNCYFSAILLGNSWTRAVWGWSITSWGVPCSRIAPLSTKTTRSDTFLANRISCVTIIIVTPVPATLVMVSLIENRYRNTLRLLENS